MKVKRNTLLLIAALVWSAAGFNILRIGLLACPPYRTIVNYLLAAVVFTVFQIFIFGRLVNKHTARISAYEDELHFFKRHCCLKWRYIVGWLTAPFAAKFTLPQLYQVLDYHRDS